MLFIRRNWLLWLYNSVSVNQWLISPHLLLFLSGHSEGKSQRVKFAWGKQLNIFFCSVIISNHNYLYLVDRTFCNVTWKVHNVLSYKQCFCHNVFHILRSFFCTPILFGCSDTWKATNHTLCSPLIYDKGLRLMLSLSQTLSASVWLMIGS